MTRHRGFAAAARYIKYLHKWTWDSALHEAGDKFALLVCPSLLASATHDFWSTPKEIGLLAASRTNAYSLGMSSALKKAPIALKIKPQKPSHRLISDPSLTISSFAS